MIGLGKVFCFQENGDDDDSNGSHEGVGVLEETTIIEKVSSIMSKYWTVDVRVSSIIMSLFGLFEAEETEDTVNLTLYGILRVSSIRPLDNVAVAELTIPNICLIVVSNVQTQADKGIVSLMPMTSINNLSDIRYAKACKGNSGQLFDSIENILSNPR